MNTSVFSATPSVAVLDARSLTVREIQFHRHPDNPAVTDTRITRHHYDIRGALSSSTDPRLHDLMQTNSAVKPNFVYQSALSGDVLRTDSADAGTTLSLSDAAGRPARAINATGTVYSWEYEDASHPGRPLNITEHVPGGQVRIAERFVYAGASAAEKGLNLAGQCVRHYDTAGRVQLNSLSLTGAVTSQSRQLLPDTLEADWQGADEAAWGASLSGIVYVTQCSTDAGGTVLTTTDAAGNTQRMAFDVAGLLKGSWLKRKGGTELVIVKSVSYSAAGQKLWEEHGNGVVTTYSYEPQTQRLTGIKTERPAGHAGGAKVLQDLRYDYDPVGNVLLVRNDAEATRYWRNQKVVPESTCTYDSLYQLVSATGREMANTGQAGPGQIAAAIQPVDGSSLTNYSRVYVYDTAGNLSQIRHSAPAPGSSYTTNLTISDRCNRGVLSSLTEIPSHVDALFTAGGQQTQLLPGQTLCWTARNELLKVTPVVRDGGADDHENYRYDGGRQRILKVSKQKTGNTIQTQRVMYLPGLELHTKNAGKADTESLQVIAFAQVKVLHWKSGKPKKISNDQQRWSYNCLTGSSGLEVDGNGNVISMEEYFPYGGTRIWTARSAVEADYKMIRYSGKERDATGLYYYGYRYYQPWAGRWLSSDPAGAVDGLNLYRMCKNNPVTFIDSNGLNSELLYSQAFKHTAKKYNVVIGVRAPNPLGETLLKEGMPSKNFHMKAKSSSTGPTAGFISEDAIYSKVSPSAYKKQRASIEKAKSLGSESLDLFISTSRINELINTGNLNPLGENRYSANYPSGIQEFEIANNGKVLNSDRKPVKVMSNPPEVGEKKGSSSPVTADYDLFALIPRVNQSVNQRPLTVPPRLLRGNFSLNFTNPKSLNGMSEDVNMGNIHHFGKTIVTNLNKEIEIEGYKGGKLVWHNDETGNPFSPGFDENDMPIFFFPSGDVFQAKTKSDLLDFYSRLRMGGYAPEYSPIFGF